MKAFVSAATVCAAMAAPAWAEPPPPASAFGRLPMVEQARISPDGKRVAILGGPAEDRRVSIATIDGAAMPALQLGPVEVVNLTWAGDQYVIARVAYWDKVTAKVAYRIERNITVTNEARDVARLLQGISDVNYMLSQPVIGVVPGPQPKAIIATGRVIWRADVASGKGEIQETGSSEHSTYAWAVDSSGTARVRADADNSHIWVMGRAAGAKAWKVMWTGLYDDDSPRIYFGYSEPDSAAYVYEEKDGVGHLVRHNLEDGAATPFGPALKAGTFGTVWDAGKRTIVGISQMEDREAVTWLDADLGAVHQSLGKLFAGQDVTLANWSVDRQRFVLRVTSPGDPPVWYLYDRVKKELSPLGDEYPELKGFHFGQTRWVKYKASDGQEIAAYLTLPPPSVAGAGKAPLIVLPHGGPQERDDYGFDFITQFLASRGYAVLRPQFRGSAGFGLAFEKAGFGEWGGKMQTDLLDGIESLRDSKEVDASRVCIVGASFGGYAALAAATLHPSAYRCAASIAGISDLGILIDEQMRAYGPASGSADSLRRLLGKAPRPLLASTSPARIAGKAGVPVLLIHGDRDTVVPIEQSQLMLRALQAADRPVQMITLADENHYLVHSSTRTQMLTALETFLANNLPVRTP